MSETEESGNCKYGIQRYTCKAPYIQIELQFSES